MTIPSLLCAVESNLAKAVKEEQAKANAGKPAPPKTEDSLADKYVLCALKDH